MPEEALDLRRIYRVIGRWLWLIAACTLLGAASAYLVSTRIPPVYRATAMLLVQPASGSSMSDYQAVLISESLTQTYSQMLRERSLLQSVILELQLPDTAGGLLGRIKVEPIPNTQLIQLSVEYANPARAALIANTLAENFIEKIQALQSGRYADSLASMQKQISELSAQLGATQARIGALGMAQTAAERSERAQLETILAESRDTYATLLQSYEQMRLAAGQSAESWDRYVAPLSSMERRLSELSVAIEGTQARTEALGRPQTPDEQSEQAHLETILAGYRNTYVTLLQNYEQMRSAAAQSTQNVIMAEAAQAPEIPIQNRMIYASLAGLVGAMVGLGVAFLLDSLDDTIQTPDDARRTLGLKVVGTVGLLGPKDRASIVATASLSPHAEAFHLLCTNICFSGITKCPRTLLVTSPGVAEGKSLTTANLSAAIAGASLRVVAVDADMRRPTLGRYFDLSPNSDGLVQALSQESVDGLLQPTHVKGLSVLASGELPESPGQLFASPSLQRLLDELRNQADVVVMDSPPVLVVADATLLARQVDGVLLVLRAGHTRKRAAQQAVESLQQVGATVIGVVLTAVPTRSSDSDASHYYGTRKQSRK